MFIAKWVAGEASGFEDALLVRHTVFVDEQGFDASLEPDELDPKSSHVIVYESNKPIATGRLFFQEAHWQIGRVCVLSENRKQGYGDLVVRMLCNKAIMMDPFCLICSDAQVKAIPLYKRIGFLAEGEPFSLHDQWHQQMILSPENFLKPCQST